MCMNLENVDCRNECRDCVYYYEDTDFCLNSMYNVKLTGEKCAVKKSKADFDNRKRKNDHHEVRKLKEEGLTAKEISQMLDIPLRSVYYILNNK